MKSNDICNGAVGHVFDSDMNLLGSGDVAINEDYEEALTLYTNNDLNSDDVHHITVEQAGDSTQFKVISVQECPHWRFNRHFHIVIQIEE